MPENEARAWWVDVQHVRESIERRRGDAGAATAFAEPASRVEPRAWTPTADHGTSTTAAELTAHIDPSGHEGAEASAGAAWLDTPPEGRHGRRFERTATDEPPIPRLAELDWPPVPPAGGTRRFEHSAGPERGGSTGALDESRASRRRSIDGADSDRAVARARRSRADADRPRTATPRADRPRTADRHAPAGRGARARTTTAPAVDVTLEREFGAPLSPPARRTVQITGRTVAAPTLPRLVEVERRRPGRRPIERLGPRPDRIALYAVLLGFFLILVAATSAHT